MRLPMLKKWQSARALPTVTRRGDNLGGMRRLLPNAALRAMREQDGELDGLPFHGWAGEMAVPGLRSSHHRFRRRSRFRRPLHLARLLGVEKPLLGRAEYVSASSEPPRSIMKPSRSTTSRARTREDSVTGLEYWPAVRGSILSAR